MIQLINFHSTLVRGGISDLAIKRRLIKHSSNIEKMVSYYRDAYSSIDLAHPILRLVYLMSWGDVISSSSYYNKADELTEELCSPLGITTSTHTGEVHQGIFWGKSVGTSILSTEGESVDMFSAHWMDLTPVRVQHVPSLAGTLVRPDLVDTDGGYGSVLVDVPLLAFMFREWQIANDMKPLDQRERPEHFIARYVFPNMLPTISTAIFTRSTWDILNLLSASDNRTPLVLADATVPVINALMDTVYEMNGTASHEQFLSNLSTVFEGSLLESFPQFKGRVSQANLWAITAGGISIVAACVNSCINNPELTEVRSLYKKASRGLNQGNIISKIGDKKFKKFLKEEIKIVSSLLV